jgi:hypothetical protein
VVAAVVAVAAAAVARCHPQAKVVEVAAAHSLHPLLRQSEAPLRLLKGKRIGDEQL